MSQSTDNPLDSGLKLLQSGQFEQAAAFFMRILEQTPDCLPAYNPLALALAKSGNRLAAEQVLQTALAMAPENTEFVRNLVFLYKQDGNPAKAVPLLKSLIERESENLKFKFELIDCYLTLADAESAESILSRIEFANLGDSEKIDYHLKYSALYHSKQETGKAIEHMLKAEVLAPDDLVLKKNLGLMFKAQGNYNQALSYLDSVIELDSEYTNAWELKGLIHTTLGQPEQAIKYLQQALKLARPEQENSIHYNLALAQLSLENYRSGWSEYEHRHNRRSICHALTIPEWRGSEDKVDRLLVIGEQGVGDMVMFASCLPELSSLIDKITLVIDRRLIPVFEVSFPFLELIGIDQQPDIKNPDNQFALSRLIDQANYDAFISLASLPLYFRQSEQDFPNHCGFLSLHERTLQNWLDEANSSHKFRLGISWSGGKDQETRMLRSIEAELFAGIFHNMDVDVVNLQYAASAEDIKKFRAILGDRFITYEQINPLTELNEFMALIASLDLVVTIDNSTAHIAAALGKDTWTLLSNWADWRWQVKRTDTPWYPSMRLYRQEKQGEWQKVIEQVQNNLSDLIKEKSSGRL